MLIYHSSFFQCLKHNSLLADDSTDTPAPPAAFTETPVSFCIKHQMKSRRQYYQSCPMFCPEHYRPVCGAAHYRDYKYRTFINGCYLDMVNCRGEEDDGSLFLL